MKKLKQFLVNHKYSILLFIVFCLAAFLRFYNVPGRYTFDYDATADAIVAYKAAHELQLPLTGNFSSAGAFTFGPWYYYHLIFFYSLSSLPYSVWLLNGILSLATVVVMYFIGKTLGGRSLGVILAALTAISPAQIGIATSSSNPNLVVFYTALALYLFITLIKHNVSAWYSFFLGVAIGIAINAHYQALPLLFFSLMLLFFTKNNKLRAFLVSTGGVAVTFLPLLFFNLTNHWHTVRNFFYYSLYGKNLIYVPNSWKIYVFDFWPKTIMEFFGIPYGMVIILVLLLGVIFAYLVYKKKVERVFIIFLAFLFLVFIYMRYYWGERHFVYLYYLQPLFFIFTGYIIYQITLLKKGIYISLLIILALVFFGLKKDSTLFATQNYPLYEQQAKKIMSFYPDKQIKIYLCQGRDFSRGSALSYFLDRAGQSAKNAEVKLALSDSGCHLPKNILVKEKLATREAELLQKLYPKSTVFHGYDFSTATEAALLREGWKPITAQDVYESEVRWYFEEQP